jgi:hypothetical protein|tara:strand:+ start:4130 stop:4318 length:189 start_codon:yes stop_codon:yes gene_type:complete
MDEDRVHTAQEYERYMPELIELLDSTAISIMSIVEECDCDNYEHTGDRYIIHIAKNEYPEEI